MVRALRNPEASERMLAIGIEPAGTTPAEFTAFVQKQVAEWAPAVRASGAKLD